MKESSLHASLKEYYMLQGYHQEVYLDGFIVDIQGGDQIVEIQTGNFSALRSKLVQLLPRYKILIVHPIAQQRWITRLDGDQVQSRRRSPRKGCFEDLFYELVRIPEFVKSPNLSIEALLIYEEEFRINDGKGSWRRSGWSIYDRKLLKVVNKFQLSNPSDYQIFLPPTIKQPFTIAQLSHELSLSYKLAAKMVYCFEKIGLLRCVGKSGRSRLFISCFD